MLGLGYKKRMDLITQVLPFLMPRTHPSVFLRTPLPPQILPTLNSNIFINGPCSKGLRLPHDLFFTAGNDVFFLLEGKPC